MKNATTDLVTSFLLFLLNKLKLLGCILYLVTLDILCIITHMWRIVTILMHTTSSKNIIVDKLIISYASSVVSVYSMSPGH